MNPDVLYGLYYTYLNESVLTPFYQSRLEKLRELKLNEVLKRKNPYLFKAKNIELPETLVRSIIDAHLSSQEETIFGNLLEGFAIYVSSLSDGGIKPHNIKSVDLEFARGDTYYIVGIKSGTNWGNSDQIGAMRNNFKARKEALRAEGYSGNIIAINGCMYGKDNRPLKMHKDDPDKSYFKYAGQEFWKFISGGDDELYRKIILPIDQEAKTKDEAFKNAYNEKVIEMTRAFLDGFVTENKIDWNRLIEYVSKRQVKPYRDKSQSHRSNILREDQFPFTGNRDEEE